MAKLSADEEKALKRLQAKREAPDSPAATRALNISIDLGDEKAVERAQRLGLLDLLASDDDDAADDDAADDDTGDDDDAPRRSGFFRER